MDDGHWYYPKDFEGLTEGRLSSTTTKSKGSPTTFNFEVCPAVFSISVDVKGHNFRITPALTVWSTGVLISLVIFTVEQFLDRNGKIRGQPGQNASRNEDNQHYTRQNATISHHGVVADNGPKLVDTI